MTLPGTLRSLFHIQCGASERPVANPDLGLHFARCEVALEFSRDANLCGVPPDTSLNGCCSQWIVSEKNMAKVFEIRIAIVDATKPIIG